MSEQSTKNQEPRTKEAPELPDPAGMSIRYRCAGIGGRLLERLVQKKIAADLAGEYYQTAPVSEPEPDPYAELKAAFAAGKVIQGEDWGRWFDISSEPNWIAWEPSFLRIKPKPEPVKVPLSAEDVPPNLPLPQLVAMTVVKLLQARRPRVGGADRLALAGDGKEGC